MNILLSLVIYERSLSPNLKLMQCERDLQTRQSAIVTREKKSLRLLEEIRQGRVRCWAVKI